MAEPFAKKAKTSEVETHMSKIDPNLHADLAAALIDYRKKRAFDPRDWIDMKVKKLIDYFSKCGLKACVTSCSGGIDSAVVLALCMKAKEQPGSTIQRVLGICQPIHSSEWALQRGKETIEAIGGELVVIDQTELHTQLSNIVHKASGIEGNPFAQGQLRSYMRTPTGYYMCQLVSQAGHPCVVMGTGNMDEDGYLAYFCKAGDGVVDVSPISDLHKSEVFKVAAELGVPASTLKAAPSADLWEGQTDENEMGFSYDFIELWTGMYIKLGHTDRQAFRANLAKEALEQLDNWGSNAEAIHKRNAHKITGNVNL